MATTEVTLTQQLAYLEQAPLYGIFIDLQKAYDVMDRECCMEIMMGYGVGWPQYTVPHPVLLG